MRGHAIIVLASAGEMPTLIRVLLVSLVVSTLPVVHYLGRHQLETPR